MTPEVRYSVLPQPQCSGKPGTRNQESITENRSPLSFVARSPMFFETLQPAISPALNLYGRILPDRNSGDR